MATVLITGTSRGIGLEAALAFARAGHKVYATMRNPAKSPLTSLAAAENLAIHISAMDVDSDESVSKAIGAILQEGPIDVLVNNAGIERMGPVEETPLSLFREVMETNYFGVIRCLQAVIPSMRERKSGCLINVSSVAGRLTMSPMAPYCASKWALEAMSEALAGEMKSFGIRVALVEPGVIDTDMAQGLGGKPASENYKQVARMVAMFANSLANNPTKPAAVALKILEIAESGTWQMRHPVGGDTAAFFGWRNSMTDEQWAEATSNDEEAYLRSLQPAAGS